MIDIIIPSYNNELGLINTLFSLGTQNFGQKVYIVDDCSNIFINYNKIIEIFQLFYPITLIKSEKNIGPGQIRQLGLKNSFSDFVMFLDCGDELYATFQIPILIQNFYNNYKLNIISTPHLMQEAESAIMVESNHNRMHGKIYRRTFLEKYNITFSEKGSYWNEDVGFNFLCKWVNKYLDFGEIAEINSPFYIWTKDINSITRLNDNAFFFQYNNIGNAYNFEHAFNSLKLLGLQEAEYLEEIYYAFCNLYISFINTVNNRDEFIDISLQGAQYFYDKILKGKNINYDLLNKIYNQILCSEICNNPNHPFLTKINQVSLINFIELLDKGDFLNDEFSLP